MVREASEQPSEQPSEQGIEAIEDESPEFLGRDYNLTIWKPTRAEREYFRNEGPRVGMLAPDFTLPALDGGSLSLEEFRGLPVVLELGSMT
jgi:hypothetical protein